MIILSKYKKLNGNSLSEYILIITVLIISITPIFNEVGKTLHHLYEHYMLGLEETEQQMSDNIAKSKLETHVKTKIIKPGDLGGTFDNPKVQCKNGFCTVDFGDYVLENLPEDFKEYVETSGYSGATNVLATLLDEIADEALTTTTPENADLIIQLAQEGHILASFERDLEEGAVSLIEDKSLKAQNTFVVPATSLINGKYRNDFEKTLAILRELLESSDKIEDQRLIEMINILSEEILFLADSMASLGKGVTGNKFTEEDLERVLHPNASLVTDIDSALICISGNGNDTGIICK